MRSVCGRIKSKIAGEKKIGIKIHLSTSVETGILERINAELFLDNLGDMACLWAISFIFMAAWE